MSAEFSLTHRQDVTVEFDVAELACLLAEASDDVQADVIDKVAKQMAEWGVIERDSQLIHIVGKLTEEGAAFIDQLHAWIHCSEVGGDRR